MKYSKISKGRDGKIKESNKESNTFIIPGTIDSHINIDNSIGAPGSLFLKDVSRGTTLFIYDPQEVVI